MSYKETSAFFIENQCMFGAYPTQHQVKELEDWGVDIFVNLTVPNERKIFPYTTTKEKISFPILDRNIPDNPKEFCALVVIISNEIDLGKKIYIHCKAGHGRSGTLVASLLCYRNFLSPVESFRKTTEYHSTRPIHAHRPRMNEYWKNRGSPQTEQQRTFVKMLFQPYRILSFPECFSLNYADLADDVKQIIFNTYLGPISGESENVEVFLRCRRLLLQELL